MLAEVAIPKTNLDTLTYSVPANINSATKSGSLVKVELKKKVRFGIVIKKTEATETKLTKDILELVEREFLPSDLLSVLIWSKKYYFASWGQLLNLTIPQSVYRYQYNRPWTIDHRTVGEVKTNPLPEFPMVHKIIHSLKENRYKTFLLFNPDNKNSVEIYLRLIEESTKLNKSTIMLVPEIILTPKFIARFQERLGNNLLCLHSGLKRSERKHIWYEIRNRDYSVVLGTRSTIFAPVKNLGLIIVDAEHDPFYKEVERHFHYNARDIAVVRAQLSNATAVLASPTPSCESFYNAKSNKYELVTIDHRLLTIDHRPFLIDMRRSKGIVISPKLRYEIKASYAKHKSCLLYINRRGYSRVITCIDCGYTPFCPNCGIPLVLHREGDKFICSLCKYRQATFDFCPQCKGNDFSYQGIGTQKVLSEVKEIINKAEIVRIDADTKKSSKRKTQNSKLLITTRLGLRGLDYLKLGLFGVILADTSLFVPDFRAQERTFQELSKIIRESSVNKDCKVIIQTYHPDNYAIYRAVQGNYLKFYEQELNLRKKLSYPPFSRLALINIFSSKIENTKKVAERIEKTLSSIKNSSMLGPSIIPHPRKPQNQIYQFLIKTNPSQSLSKLISRGELVDDKVDIDINIDPI